MRDVSAIASFLEDLPKTEHHFHFEGALSWAMVRKFHPQGPALPEIPPWYGRGYFSDFSEFLDIFRHYIRPCLVSVEHYCEISRDMIERLQLENIVYSEWNLSLRVLKDHGLDFFQVFQSIHRLISEISREKRPHIRLIAGINREFSLEEKLDILDRIDLIPSIVGFDMHGWETEGDLAKDELFFQRARERNLLLKVHAGELGGALNVRTAIEHFGITHISHGVRAAEDQSLLEELARRQVFLHLCPSSNIQLGVISSFDKYPLPRILEAGVKATINTDDPLIFNCRLVDEFQRIALMGLDLAEICLLVVNGIQAAMLASHDKVKLQQTVMDRMLDFLSDHPDGQRPGHT